MAKKIQKKSESGMVRTHLLIPKHLHKKFKLIAVAEDTTMSKMIADLIERDIERREKKDRH
jgi:hypothetical protein